MTTVTLVAFLPALLVVLLPFFAASYAIAEEQQQCLGRKPMPSVSRYLGASLDESVADLICCHNHLYAEPYGYLEWPEVDLFSRLNPAAETTFYDSVCGIPVFVAPRNRTFEEFRDESLRHGWPSFRPGEVVSENVVIHPNGRMESRECRTHLGHNLPDSGDGRDRYCIDLVCIAGTPLDRTEGSNSGAAIPETVSAAGGDLAYPLSEERSPGITMLGIVAAVSVGLVLFFAKRARLREEVAGKTTDSSISQSATVVDDDGTIMGERVKLLG